MKTHFSCGKTRLPSLRLVALACAVFVFGCAETKSNTSIPAGTTKAVGASPSSFLQEREQNDWPMFRGDSLGSGFVDVELPAELSIKWEHKIDNGSFESTAAIVDGVVYIGDLDGKFLALDLETGEKKWEFQTDIGFIGGAAVRDGRVYIGNLDGFFFCLNCKDGTELWKYETGAEINAGANFYKDNVVFGSQDATLYCLDQKTGEEVWKYELQDQVRCSPTIVENRAFVAGCDGMLHIVNLETGEPAGSVTIDSPTGVTPAVMGDYAYFGTEQAGIFAVNWKDSTVLWQIDDPDGVTSTRSSAAVTKDHVVYGARNRKVNSVDPKTGELKWVFKTRGPVDSSPVIARDKVYVGADDRRFYVLNLDDGKKLSEIELNGKVTGSPAVSTGRVVIATNRGVVYCLGE